MVKAEASRNYYADLDLPPDASSDDIKKQYKKLALKFHPDRNSGREAEVVPRFQAIQAAFEILNDPQQKAKYDADRRKFGLFAQSSRPNPPPRNPYTTATRDFSKYPPPPRRTEPRYRAYEWATPGARTSAGRPPPPPPPQPPQPPPPSQPQPSPQSGADRFTRFFPTPPTAPQPPNSRNDAEARQSHFSAWQYMAGAKARANQDNEFAKAQAQAQAQNPYGASAKPSMARSHTTRTPRKTGFDPATPGADEPPAAGTSAYYTHTRYDSRPIPPNVATEMPATTSSEDNDPPFTEGTPRRSAPYHSLGGEKTTFSAEALRRAASTRNSPVRPFSTANLGDHMGHQNTARHRSASPASRKPFQDSAGNSPANNTRQGRPKQGGNATRPFFDMYASSDDEDDTRPSAGAHQQNGTGTANGEATSSQPAAGRPPSQIFNMPPGADAATPNHHAAKARSAESINTKFSPSDWHGQFKGQTDYFGPPAPDVASTRSRASPVRGRLATRSSTGKAQQQMPPPPPPPVPEPPQQQVPPINTSNQASQPGQVKFSPAEWQQTFKEASWAYPPPPNPPSPTKQQPTRRRSTATTRKTTAIPVKTPRPAAVSDEQDDSDASSSSSEDTGDNLGPNAMDIDVEPPAKSVNLPVPDPELKGARRVSTDPARPEWRESKTTRRPSQPSVKSSTVAANAAADAANAAAVSGFGLNSLKNVAPFAPSNDGINHLSELGADLPFQSQASPSRPTPSADDNHAAAPAINLTAPINPCASALMHPGSMPKPPRPPVEPSTSGRLTRKAFHEYVHRMTAYVAEWNRFNVAMLAHFAARQAWVDALAEAFGHPFAWVGAVGDTKDGGFQAYVEALREDEKVREHWSFAAERHKEVMERFGVVRERMLKDKMPMIA